MRTPLAVLAAIAILSLPAVASAQEDPNCPPGGWFCEETPPPAAVAEDEGADMEPGPPTDEPGRRWRPPPPYYEGGPPIAVGRVEPPPKPVRKRWRRKWGLNLHLEGALLGGGKYRDDDAGMGGIGFSFRYRPLPHFALDTGLDFVGGVDWQGNNRHETALLFNAMVFVNPRDAVQFYMLGGIGFSGATVSDRDANGDSIDGTERHYSYFGGQLGAGLEFRVSHRVSLNVDVVGFVRGRTDDKARYTPEFVDPETGQTTNSSGGGLLRGGITFYW